MNGVAAGALNAINLDVLRINFMVGLNIMFFS